MISVGVISGKLLLLARQYLNHGNWQKKVSCQMLIEDDCDFTGRTSPTLGGIISAVGNTPAIRLARLDETTPASIYAKLEFLNPGGSMKDRSAINMIRRAMASNELAPGGVVIESSSGNMGIGLAQACRYLGLRFICVIDPGTTYENRRLLETYGVELSIVTEPHKKTGQYLDARLERVRKLQEETPGAYHPDQYTNEGNAEAHFQTTAPEFFAQMPPPDVILLAVSTCGTLAGFNHYIKMCGHETRLIAVDAHGSSLFGGPPGTRHTPGLGSSRRALQVDPDQVEVMCVDDTDCVIGCQMLLDREAILAGGSSGGLAVAALRLASQLPEHSRIALLLADRGERYLNTIYSPEWVCRHCPQLDNRKKEILTSK